MISYVRAIALGRIDGLSIRLLWYMSVCSESLCSCDDPDPTSRTESSPLLLQQYSLDISDGRWIFTRRLHGNSCQADYELYGFLNWRRLSQRALASPRQWNFPKSLPNITGTKSTGQWHLVAPGPDLGCLLEARLSIEYQQKEQFFVELHLQYRKKASTGYGGKFAWKFTY